MMTPEAALEQRAAQQMGALMLSNLKLSQLVETQQAEIQKLRETIAGHARIVAGNGNVIDMPRAEDAQSAA